MSDQHGTVLDGVKGQLGRSVDRTAKQRGLDLSMAIRAKALASKGIQRQIGRSFQNHIANQLADHRSDTKSVPGEARTVVMVRRCAPLSIC
jgi:hypothetical protein